MRAGAESTTESRSGRLVAVIVVLGLAVVAVLGLVALDPGFLVALTPGWLTGRASKGGTLLVVGGVTLLLPLVAAVVAQSRGRSRAAGWFVVLTLLAVLPAAVALKIGASEVRQAHDVESPGSGACVERSGGDTTCPGG